MNKSIMRWTKLLIFIFNNFLIILFIYNYNTNLGLINFFHIQSEAEKVSYAKIAYILILICIEFIIILIHEVLQNLTISVTINAHSISTNSPNFSRIIVILSLAITVVLSTYLFLTFKSQQEITQARHILSKEVAIVHAGGTIKDSEGNEYTYTNSYDALVNSYSSNNRIVELDFTVTKDNSLVCAHEIDTTGVTELEFLENKLAGGFAPLSLNSLISYMCACPDLFIVTDGKSYNPEVLSILGKNVPEQIKKRFFVQIYNRSEYQIAKNNGFDNIIFTLYLLEGEEKDTQSVISVLKKYDIMAVTFWESRLQETEFYSAIVSTDTPICVHTVNDPTSMINDICNYHVSGIYTDNTDNDWIRNVIK